MRAAALREQGSLAESEALVREADAGFREGLEKVERAISMMPTYAHARLLRATMLESYVGDREGAIAEYEEVLRLMPNHPQRAAIEAGIARLRSQAPGGARSR
jgi:tetratricopeptide (TPR) repeat protein